MYVGILEIKIRISSAFSLKDKRKVLKSLFERVDHRYNVAYSEIDLHDIYNLSVIGFSVVSGSYSQVEKQLNNIVEYLDDDYRYEIIDINRDIL